MEKPIELKSMPICTSEVKDLKNNLLYRNKPMKIKTNSNAMIPMRHEATYETELHKHIV